MFKKVYVFFIIFTLLSAISSNILLPNVEGSDYAITRNVRLSESDPAFSLFKLKTISNKYSEGEFLIYDCVDKHYVCADQTSEQICKRKYEKESRENYTNFTCLVLQKFENSKKCHQKQFSVIHELDTLRPYDICLNYFKY